jgi:LysM repeat protein
VDPRTRRELTQYGAPAALLAAVTIAVLLIKSGLSSGEATKTTTSARPVAAARSTTAPPTTTRLVLTGVSTTTTTSTPAGQYHVIQSGDTLGSIAQKYGTTTAELLTLNPGIDPAALRIGQQLRVH